MHIEHPTKQQDDLFQFMIFVCGGGLRVRVHSIIVAAVSDFIKSWMESTFVPNLEYYVYLPDIERECVQTLLNICYGVDTAVPQEQLDPLHNLADMLGITVDLPFRIVEPPIDSGSSFSVGGEKAPQELDDDNAGVDVLPLCCWHCNTPFADLETLKVHVKTHKGERFKSKRHKCQKCKKVLPSMWKLRQHLLTHATATPRRRTSCQPTADHQYAADTSPDITGSHSKPACKKDDHPYATPPTTVAAAADEARSNVSRDHSYLGSTNPSPAKEQHQRPTHEEESLQSVLDDHFYTNKQDGELKGAAKRETSLQSKMLKDVDQKFCETQKVAAAGNQAGSRPQSHLMPHSKYESEVNDGEAAEVSGTDPRVETIAVLTKAANPPLPPPPGKYPIPALNKPRISTGFPCDQCDKVFPQRYRRVRHVREVHDKEKRHGCPYCEKSFFKITSRDRHQLTHEPYRPTKWRCANCHGMFTTETSLVYHVEHKVCLKVR